MTVLSLLEGWLKANRKRSASSLGDRTHYVGMSDIGKAFGCMRAAVAGKAYGNSLYPDPATLPSIPVDIQATLLKKIRTLERGHEQEAGLASAFDALGYKFLQQLEINIVVDGCPITAHLDFVIFHPDRIEIVESKSNERPPETLYAEYEAQLYGQIGLLHRYYSQPVFSVKNEQGQVVADCIDLPAVASIFGVKLPENGYPASSIDGYVLSMSSNDVKVFGPYHPSEVVTDIVTRKGVAIWDAAEKVKNGSLNMNDLEYAHGFNPLCDFCAYNEDCPKFTDSEVSTEFASMLYQHAELQAQISADEARLEQIKDQLSAAYSGRGLNGQDWINAGIGRFKLAENTRKSFDQDKLRQKLAEMGFCEDEVKELIADCTKKSTFSVLRVSKINPRTY